MNWAHGLCLQLEAPLQKALLEHEHETPASRLSRLGQQFDPLQPDQDTDGILPPPNSPRSHSPAAPVFLYSAQECDGVIRFGNGIELEGGKALRYPNGDTIAPNWDGSYSLHGGVHLTPDMLLQFPDGSSVDPRGHVLPRHSSSAALAYFTDHRLPLPPGQRDGDPSPTEVTPGGPHQRWIPKGSLTLPGGSWEFPNGMVLHPSGDLQQPEGSVLRPDGRLVYRSGKEAVKLRGGLHRLRDGTVLMPDLRVQFSDGTVLHPDGAVQLRCGEYLEEGSRIPLATLEPHRMTLGLLWDRRVQAPRNAIHVLRKSSTLLATPKSAGCRPSFWGSGCWRVRSGQGCMQRGGGGRWRRAVGRKVFEGGQQTGSDLLPAIGGLQGGKVGEWLGLKLDPWGEHLPQHVRRAAQRIGSLDDNYLPCSWGRAGAGRTYSSADGGWHLPVARPVTDCHY